MKRDEAIRLVHLVQHSIGSEKEIDDMITRLIHSFPGAKISDMIFWETSKCNASEIVDEALRRTRSKSDDVGA